MIDKRMEEAINDQVNAELYSAYLYLAMSADFSARSLPGFAHWMRVQAQEELLHAMRLYDYLLQRGGSAMLGQIDTPPLSWETVLAAFENAYEHEQYVTGRINSLVDIAEEIKDHATRSFLQWFVDEQVEEEDSASDIVSRLKLVGDSGHGLLMMDRDMAARPDVLAPVAPASE